MHQNIFKPKLLQRSIAFGYRNVISVIKFCSISRNWQFKDVCSKRTENQHHTSILEANYYLSVYIVHYKLASSTEQKILFSFIQICHCTLKSKKSTILKFVIRSPKSLGSKDNKN